MRQEPEGVATGTERGDNMNRKGACHQLPVVLAVHRSGLQQEPKGGVSPVACGSRRVRKGATTRTEEPKGVATRTERGCNDNRKGQQHEPKGGVSPVACGFAVYGKGLQQEPKNRKGLQQEPKGVVTTTERGNNMNRKGACHRLPVVLAVLSVACVLSPCAW